MKAVMLSLRPQWCEKIFNGSKTAIKRRKKIKKIIDILYTINLGRIKNEKM